MTNSAITIEGLTNLINSYLKRSKHINWLEWLPLTEVVAETPERWVEAFNQLSEEKQYDFIDLLRDEQSGCLADGLLIVLAAHAYEISDEQVRQFVLEDAEHARSRHISRIQVIRDRMEPMSLQLAGAKERLQEGFDLTQEITNLEHQLAETRARENKQDEKFAQIHALERDILRMETRKRILEHYDEPARTSYLNEMKHEIESLDQRKASLEQAIAEIIGKRDALKREVAASESELKALEIEIESLRSRGEETKKGLARLRDVFENTRKEEEGFKAEHIRLMESVEQNEKKNREVKGRIDASRKRLLELEKEAKESRLDDLERRIREVYSLLPADNADRVCH